MRDESSRDSRPRRIQSPVGLETRWNGDQPPVLQVCRLEHFPRAKGTLRVLPDPSVANAEPGARDGVEESDGRPILGGRLLQVAGLGLTQDPGYARTLKDSDHLIPRPPE